MGWPKGKPNPLGALLPLFPAAGLRADLQAHGLSPTGAALKAGLQPGVVLRWTQGKAVPRPKSLKKLLEAIGVDPEPYERFLQPSTVSVVCPTCSKVRTLRKGELGVAGRRAQGRTELSRLADGRYRRPCRACSAAQHGRKALRQLNVTLLRKELGRQEADDVSEWAKGGDAEGTAALNKARVAILGGQQQLDKNRAKFRQMVRAPKGAEHRHAISLAHISRGSLKKPFSLCLLCGLLVHGHPWHQPCALRWLYRSRRKAPLGQGAQTQPPSVRRRGRPSDENLERNYHWLMVRRAGGGSRARLLAEADLKSFSKQAVNKGIESFLRLLPGSWDLVFSKNAGRRRANVGRQELVQLPHELEFLVGAGQRDGLIQKLHDFNMPEREIARLTGASPYRVRGFLR